MPPNPTCSTILSQFSHSYHFTFPLLLQLSRRTRHVKQERTTTLALDMKNAPFLLPSDLAWGAAAAAAAAGGESFSERRKFSWHDPPSRTKYRISGGGGGAIEEEEDAYHDDGGPAHHLLWVNNRAGRRGPSKRSTVASDIEITPPAISGLSGTRRIRSKVYSVV